MDHEDKQIHLTIKDMVVHMKKAHLYTKMHDITQSLSARTEARQTQRAQK